MYELKDTVVLITGAAKGIGAAFVKILVEQLAKHVRILDIDEAAGVLLQNELNEKYGAGTVKFTKCDITNDDELFEAVKDTTEQYGYIDLVVNNAGVTNESDSDCIRKEIEVNVTALVNGTVKAIDLMRKDKGGKGGTVINVSSVAALIKRSPLLFVYAATKSAVLQFSNCIGVSCVFMIPDIKEWDSLPEYVIPIAIISWKEPYYSKTGVRVITICYGPTTTGIIEQMASFDEDIQMQELAALYPMQSAEVAAQGSLEAYRRGESGSTWLINNGKPAKDITSTINKAYAEFAQLLTDD